MIGIRNDQDKNNIRKKRRVLKVKKLVQGVFFISLVNKFDKSGALRKHRIFLFS
jgi:hypothetical protein